MRQTCQKTEEGFVLVTMVTILVPLLIIVAAFGMTMTMRSQSVVSELDEERALLAAESGVDEAIYRGQIGTLTSGSVYTRNLGSGLSYSMEPTYLKTDGADNDNDTQVDEDDEDVFQVIVTGQYRGKKRRIAAYLGPVPLLPTLNSAVTVTNPNIDIDLIGTALISGHDKKINGGAGAGSSLYGMSITSPGTVADLSGELTGGEPGMVVGQGSAPSLGTTTAIDVPTLVAQVQNSANLVLTSKKYASYTFGDGSAGTANIAYRAGDVRFAGNSQGAGILVVTGDLIITGTFRFDGVIIVLGSVINSAGTADVYGGLIVGPTSPKLEVKGTLNIHSSLQATTLANSLAGSYKAFNGWQELSK